VNNAPQNSNHDRKCLTNHQKTALLKAKTDCDQWSTQKFLHTERECAGRRYFKGLYCGEQCTSKLKSRLQKPDRSWEDSARECMNGLWLAKHPKDFANIERKGVLDKSQFREQCCGDKCTTALESRPQDPDRPWEDNSLEWRADCDSRSTQKVLLPKREILSG
jgi:hypothetical protein